MNTTPELESFNKKISELTNSYYSENKKNLFFKSSQKMDCASNVTNQIGIDNLIQNSVYIIPNTNFVFMDYTVFKTYATPENYSKIVNYILTLFDYCINTFGEYTTYVNLDTFTISAAQRYKSVIELFLNTCMSSNTEYSIRITKMFICNTPNTFHNISNILNPFIDQNVKSKIVLIDKTSSKDVLNSLFCQKDGCA